MGHLSERGPSPCACVEGDWGSEVEWEQALVEGGVFYWLQRRAGPLPRAAESAAE